MPSDIELLHQYYATGDQQAVQTLFARHYPAVYQVAKNLVHDDFAANDIAQATFLKVIQAGRDYQPTGSFRNWVLTIAVNEARQSKRGERRAAERDALYAWYLGKETAAAVAERDAMRVEFEQKLEQVLAGFPEHLKEPLVLHYFQDMPFHGIAEVLDLPKSTVQSRIEAAVARLKAELRRGGFTAMVARLPDFFPAVQSAQAGMAGSAVASAWHILATWISTLPGVVTMKISYGVILIILLCMLAAIGLAPFWLSSGENDSPMDVTVAPVATRAPTSVEATSIPRDTEPGPVQPVVEKPAAAVIAPNFEHPIIAGIVLDAETRRPIPDVTADVHDFRRDVTLHAVTDAKGMFQFPELASRAECFHLRLTHPEYAAAERDDCPLGREPETYLLHRGGEILGTVMDYDGRPASGITVRALRVRADLDKPKSEALRLYANALPADFAAVRECKSGEAGEFHLSALPDGRYILSVETPGRMPLLYTGASEYAGWGNSAGYENVGVPVTAGSPARVAIRMLQPASVTLRVIDAATRQPIPGVRLQAGGTHEVSLTDYSFMDEMVMSSWSGETDAVGQCSMSLWLQPGGEYCCHTVVFGRKDGYLTVEDDIQGADGQAITIEMYRGAKVWGYVTDDRGKPRPNMVIVSRLGRKRDAKAFTDADGRYEFSEPLGWSDDRGFFVIGLDCWDSRWQACAATRQVTARHGDTVQVNFGGSGQTGIAGRILVGGRPLSNREVNVDHHDQEHVSNTMLTDGDGRFVFEGLIEGDYQIIVGLSETASLYASTSVVAGRMTEWNRELGEVIVNGFTVNADTGEEERPLAPDVIDPDMREISLNDAGWMPFLRVHSGEPGAFEFVECRIGEAGRFEFCLPRCGLARVELRDAFGFYQKNTLLLDTRETSNFPDVRVEFARDAADGRIRLHVVDAGTGAPVVGGKGWWSYSNATIQEFVAADPQGWCEIEGLPMAEITLWFEGLAYVRVSTIVRLTPERKEEEVTLQCQPAGRLQVTSSGDDRLRDEKGDSRVRWGDIILDYDGTPIRHQLDLLMAMYKRMLKEGGTVAEQARTMQNGLPAVESETRVPMKIQRGGEILTEPVPLGKLHLWYKNLPAE